ncbi:MAG: SpoIIE family protein phosphatase [Candidatus Fermentibacteraceae bacterium]|nr:SpoIIE family protein phosphatase [Candidatus Fermentibacteraceae bacterium]
MNSFTLSVVFEGRELPGGIEGVLRSDLDQLVPPRWADSLQVSDPGAGVPDALLLIINGALSPRLRNVYFNCYRNDIPIAALCFHKEPDDDNVIKSLSGSGRCWEFTSAVNGRELVRTRLQEWLRGLNRESFPYPEGKDLVDSYGSVEVLKVDRESLEKAGEVFCRRGFVCLSGSIGAGKTTIARKLLIEASRDGLNPVEMITRDLDFSEVVRLLTGPEDCALFLDLDTFRRMVDIYPARLWSLVISMMIRATETRHRLILATSSSGIASIFDTHNDAHVSLPEPSTGRQWRLEEGREALEWFRRLDSIEKAELLLLAAFDPVVAEAVFKRVLFRFLDRIIVQERKRFPTSEELEESYGNSMAAGAVDPFRRISGKGEVYLAVSDSVKMWAIDRGIRELLEMDAPVIRSFIDILLESEEPNIRRAGYFLAGFYTSLSDEVKAKLLLHVASERSRLVLLDVLSSLLSSRDNLDESIVSMYGMLMARGNSEVRQSVAETLGRKWVLESMEFRDTVDAAVKDPEPAVRGRLLQGLTMWGMSEKGEKIYREYLEDDSFEVRQGLVLYLGSNFPNLDSREYEILNEVLEKGDTAHMTSLIMGLLDRRLEDFNQEFNDLLWVLMDRLPPGGKGQLAWRIGARLRFFSPEVRASMRSDLAEEDILLVTRCMLMNYSSLFEEEKKTLWELTRERTAKSREFASLVLRYYNIMEDEMRGRLLRSVLESDHYEGREALSQLICLGRKDLNTASLKFAGTLMKSSEFEKRAVLPFFLLWNMEDLGGPVEEYVRSLVKDPSSFVRRRLAGSIRGLGRDDGFAHEILSALALDDKRAVRAEVAVCLGELEKDDPPTLTPVLSSLLGDDDAFVRLSALKGLLSNVSVSREKLLPVVIRSLGDQAPDMRIEAVKGLRKRPDLYSSSDLDSQLADRFSDPDRNVRMEVIRLVTETPGLLGSDIIRKRMPDILLDRMSTGHAISEELNMARKIQLDLLPDHPPTAERCDIEIFYRPAREVGGDYFDFFDLPDRNLGVAIADVAGKGIPAALTMAGLKGNLEAYVQSIYSISEIMQKVNESSILGEGDPIMAGLFYGVLDTDSGKFTYVNAGHNPPLLLKRDGAFRWLDRGGLILGISTGAFYEHETVELDSGDVLVLYTDGLTEAMDGTGREFGNERLKTVVSDNRDLSAHQISNGILEAVNSHSGNSPQSDDQTLVVLKYR